MEPWMQNAITVIMNTIFLLNVIFILQLFFGVNLCRKKKTYIIIALLFIIVDSTAIILADAETEIEFWAICGFIILCTCFLTKQYRIRSVLFTIPAILLDIEWSFVIELIDTALHLPKDYIIISGSNYAPFAFWADVIIFIILLFLLIYFEKKHIKIQFSVGEAICLTVFCFFSPLIISFFELLEGTYPEYIYTLCWVCFVIILNAAIFYGIIYRNHTKYYKSLSENFKEQFNTEYLYFKDYKKQQKDIVKFRHDYRNHMLLLASMLANGDYDKARSYFSNLNLIGENPGKKYTTGNEIVDILLNAKQEQLEELSIKVNGNGGLEPLQVLEDADCCILFSNLIDNAIEANMKCPQERHITIKATREGSMYMVELSNRTDKTAEKQENLIRTSKNKGTHGIGTKNAFEIIEKYQGEYRFFIREQDFVMQIIFPIDRLSQNRSRLSDELSTSS